MALTAELLHRGGDYRNRLEHSYPSCGALFMWRYQPERTQLPTQRCAIQGIRDEHVRIEDARIEFRQREDHAVSVGRFSNYVSSQRGSSKLFALRYSGSLEELRQKHTFVGFVFLVVRVEDRESFSGHLFEVTNRKNERRGNGAVDSQLRGGRCG